MGQHNLCSMLACSSQIRQTQLLLTKQQHQRSEENLTEQRN